MIQKTIKPNNDIIWKAKSGKCLLEGFYLLFFNWMKAEGILSLILKLQAKIGLILTIGKDYINENYFLKNAGKT